MASETVSSRKPVKATLEELEAMDKSELIKKYQSLYEYLSIKDTQKLIDDLQAAREAEEKARQQHAEATRREALLIKTLTEKQSEIAELANQNEELKQYQLPSNAQLRSMLLEPTVNIVFNRMKKELESTKQRLEDSQNELSAWKFTQDSQTGKQLMARCRTLFKENEELGKQISQGRIAKLEGEIALEKKLVDELRVAQTETDEFVTELDDDMEGMQATIFLLQQQLKDAKEQLAARDSQTAANMSTQQTDHHWTKLESTQEQEIMDTELTNDFQSSEKVHLNGQIEPCDRTMELMETDKVVAEKPNCCGDSIAIKSEKVTNGHTIAAS